MDEVEQCRIMKKIIQRDANNGLIVNEVTLDVKGETLKEVEKAFKRRWKS